MFKIYKELLKLNTKSKVPTNKCASEMNRPFSKEKTQFLKIIFDGIQHL